jgi:hypothetical protein
MDKAVRITKMEIIARTDLSTGLLRKDKTVNSAMCEH